MRTKRPTVELTQDCDSNEYGVIFWLSTDDKKEAMKELKSLVEKLERGAKK